jgi:hypothetical protein
MLAAGSSEGEDVRSTGLAVGVGGIAKTTGARMGMAAEALAGVNVAVASPPAPSSATGRGACQTILIGSVCQL